MTAGKEQGSVALDLPCTKKLDRKVGKDVEISDGRMLVIGDEAFQDVTNTQVKMIEFGLL